MNHEPYVPKSKNVPTNFFQLPGEAAGVKRKIFVYFIFRQPILNLEPTQGRDRLPREHLAGARDLLVCMGYQRKL